jgi:DNA modification methylase
MKKTEQLNIFPTAEAEKNNSFVEEKMVIGNNEVKKIIVEFWTSKQRQASSLQEISYRACFKPQLPNYFIDKYTQKGDVVYDPFGGRGTTAVEAALMGRRIIQNDINPISTILLKVSDAKPKVLRLDKKFFCKFNSLGLSFFKSSISRVSIFSSK